MRALVSALVASFTVLSAPSSAEDAPPSDTLDQTGSYAGEYLCVATMGGGVKFDPKSGKWKSASFDVTEQRFIVKAEALGLAPRRNVNDGLETGMSYSVKIALGGGDRSRECESISPRDPQGVSWFGAAGMFACRQGVSEFRFNLSRLIFQKTSPMGYVDGGGDSPHILIGECVTF